MAGVSLQMRCRSQPQPKIAQLFACLLVHHVELVRRGAMDQVHLEAQQLQRELSIVFAQQARLDGHC